MSKRGDWRSYVDEQGDFELPAYVYKTISDLMKVSLDLGTLLSDDPARLRAYKEQIKSIFKSRWLQVAQALEEFEIIMPCGCSQDEYCQICGGSRYRLNVALSPDLMREITIAARDEETAEKLRKGLEKALEETDGR